MTGPIWANDLERTPLMTVAERYFNLEIRGFVARHRAALPPERTEMLCLESIGSPDPVLVEGEGMLRMRMYPEATREAVASAAAEAGVPVLRNLKTVLATDALIALRAGYPIATLASIDEIKLPSNYHSPRDRPEMIRLRRAKSLACARAPIGLSETTQPCSTTPRDSP